MKEAFQLRFCKHYLFVVRIGKTKFVACHFTVLLIKESHTKDFYCHDTMNFLSESEFNSDMWSLVNISLSSFTLIYISRINFENEKKVLELINIT